MLSHDPLGVHPKEDRCCHLFWGGSFSEVEDPQSEGPPVLLGISWPALAVPWGGPSEKGKGTNRTGGSVILKLIWGGNLLYFPGFGDLQPYETWKFRICSESVSGVFPDLFRISHQKCLTVLGAPPTQGTRNFQRLIWNLNVGVGDSRFGG